MAEAPNDGFHHFPEASRARGPRGTRSSSPSRTRRLPAWPQGRRAPRVSGWRLIFEEGKVARRDAGHPLRRDRRLPAHTCWGNFIRPGHRWPGPLPGRARPATSVPRPDAPASACRHGRGACSCPPTPCGTSLADDVELGGRLLKAVISPPQGAQPARLHGAHPVAPASHPGSTAFKNSSAGADTRTPGVAGPGPARTPTRRHAAHSARLRGRKAEDTPAGGPPRRPRRSRNPAGHRPGRRTWTSLPNAIRDTP